MSEDTGLVGGRARVSSQVCVVGTPDASGREVRQALGPEWPADVSFVHSYAICTNVYLFPFPFCEGHFDPTFVKGTCGPRAEAWTFRE